MRDRERQHHCSTKDIYVSENFQTGGVKENAPIRVDLGGVEAKDALNCANDGAEGLVDLEASDILDLELRTLESDRKRDGRCKREVNWCNSGISVGYEKGESVSLEIRDATAG